MTSGYSKAIFLDNMRKRTIPNNQGIFLYNWSGVNYRGETTDTKEKYVNVAIDELLSVNQNHYFKNLGHSERLQYRVESHKESQIVYDSFNKENSNRKEEKFAMQMLLASKERQETFGILGKMLDYQVPLKARKEDLTGGQVDQSNKFGKIDLISVSDNEAWLIELKLCDSSETLLRSLLEIESYCQILNVINFQTSYDEVKNKPIRKAVLIGCHCSVDYQHDHQRSVMHHDSTIYRDSEKLENCSAEMHSIQRLLNHYQIEVFVIHGHGQFHYNSTDITLWDFSGLKHIRCSSI
jgi:hypothetical protein